MAGEVYRTLLLNACIDNSGATWDSVCATLLAAYQQQRDAPSVDVVYSWKSPLTVTTLHLQTSTSAKQFSRLATRNSAIEQLKEQLFPLPPPIFPPAPRDQWYEHSPKHVARTSVVDIDMNVILGAKYSLGSLSSIKNRTRDELRAEMKRLAIETAAILGEPVEYTESNSDEDDLPFTKRPLSKSDANDTSSDNHQCDDECSDGHDDWYDPPPLLSMPMSVGTEYSPGHVHPANLMVTMSDDDEDPTPVDLTSSKPVSRAPQRTMPSSVRLDPLQHASPSQVSAPLESGAETIRLALIKSRFGTLFLDDAGDEALAWNPDATPVSKDSLETEAVKAFSQRCLFPPDGETESEQPDIDLDVPVITSQAGPTSLVPQEPAKQTDVNHAVRLAYTFYIIVRASQAFCC